MPSQFMVDIEGTGLSEIEREILKHPHTGAVILFTRNFINQEQLQKLIDEINGINPDIFITVDQEGGNVQRFQRQGFTSLPAARIYGTVYDKNQQAGLELAWEYGDIMAKELLACGVDLSLAPVLDVQDQSTIIAGLDRAFHAAPQSITLLAGAFIAGMNAAGMPAVGKHFPGHGSVMSDSHISMPVSLATKTELEANDLKPFINLINKGLLAAVMPAHVTYKTVDAENPAGFSPIWLQEILRTQLGFTGLVLSDCLSMKGADIGNLTTRAEKALVAGCDMLIVCHQPRERLLQLLQNFDAIQPAESLERIHAFKNQMVRFSKPKNTGKTLPVQDKLKSLNNEPDNGISHEEYNKTTTV